MSVNQYYCPNCGKEVSFGESICPFCNEDVTSLWERMNHGIKETPKVAPGMGGMDQSKPAPFPSPDQNKQSPFPPSANQGVNPFPTPSASDNSPFPPSNSADSPFPPSGSGNDQISASPAPFPPVSESKPFPSQQDSKEIQGAYLEIPRIGAKIPIDENPFRVGRHEIQNGSTIDLPDLNAYKNISRKRPNSEHFIIHLENDQYLIEDIHSTNGTYLGTTKLGPGVPPQPLKNGDKIIVPIEEYGKMVQLEIIFRK